MTSAVEHTPVSPPLTGSRAESQVLTASAVLQSAGVEQERETAEECRGANAKGTVLSASRASVCLSQHVRCVPFLYVINCIV